MENFEEYLIRLKDLLAGANQNKVCADARYVDLAHTNPDPALPELIPGESLPEDPLARAVEVILDQIRYARLEKINLGINELLKNYVLTVDESCDERLANRYLFQIRLIFKRCLMHDFPYQDEVWNYLGACLQTVGLYLMNRSFFKAAELVVEYIGHMGKTAARHGLPTASTQSCLRTLENRAGELGRTALAAKAKNVRFNLEL
jgi:hypothetical protein